MKKKQIHIHTRKNQTNKQIIIFYLFAWNPCNFYCEDLIHRPPCIYRIFAEAQQYKYAA